MDCLKDTPLPTFPVEGLMPTEDTQAASFLKKCPQYDGRGSIIAILDTGIDPGAAGMQVTTTGDDKIIDIVDCTNSGDVHMSDEQTIQTSHDCKNKLERYVIGSNGKKLILDPSWTIPSGKVRVGVKMLYDLTPSELTSRIKDERKAMFMVKHDLLVHDIRAKLDHHLLRKDDSISEKCKQDRTNELNSQLAALKTLKDSYEDFGPELDCVVFHDGSNYNAVVNNSVSNDLTGLTALTDYKIGRKYAVLDAANMFNYSVKIYDNGKLLSVVTVAGSHGTHVAGIAAGHNPDNSSMNGVAPGAQLISLKIGDHRLGSLEVGAGLTRAINSIIEHKADLANMSYGEATSVANSGFWVDMLQQSVVRKHHCIFVSSAGNEGPGLSTLGAPGGTSEDLIGVGAYVGHQQMRANYFMLKKVRETPYTWSSLGPSYDGSRGVAVYGPGSAVASYPQYTLKKYEMINGTSMSSPNVCGCLALLVSGMKRSKMRVTPYRVKRAITTTSKNVDDIMDAGFIQVEKAWNYLVENKCNNDLDIAYRISIASRNAARGLYYREFNESTRLNVEDVTVTPKFLDSPFSDLPGQKGEQSRGLIKREQFDYDRKLVIVATESWIQVPDCLYVNYIGRSFRVSVDCKFLQEGKLHIGAIHAYDSENSASGPVFSIPVTVTKPINIDHSAQLLYKNICFKPTELKRWYINVPTSASKMVVTVFSTNLTASAPANFIINCCQLLPQERFSLYEYQKYFYLAQGSYISGADGVQTEKHFVDVIGGVTLEIVLGQFWSQFDRHDIDLKVEFTGLQLQSATGDTNSVFLNTNAPSTKVSLKSDLRRTDNITPTIKLDTLRRTHLPQKSEIKPLTSSRDILPGEASIYALKLSYKLSLTPGKVTLGFPACDNFIYDSWFEDKMIQVFDCNKKRLAVFSVYPSSIDIQQKGDYTVLVLVRHSNSEALEKIKNSPLFADMSVSNVSLPISNTFSNAFVSSSPTKVSKISIDKGKLYNLYVGGLTYGSSGNGTNAGDLMMGTLDFNNQDLYSVKVQALVPIQPPSTPSSSKDSEKQNSNTDSVEKKITEATKTSISSAHLENESDEDKLNKALRDLKISWISKITDKAAMNKLVSELLSAGPACLELYLKLLDVYDHDKDQSFFFIKSESKSSKLSDVSESSSKLLETANKAIEIIDIKDLALKIKNKPESSSPKSALEAYSKLESQKKKLLSALLKKCRALIYINFVNQLYSQKSDFALWKDEYMTELTNLNISTLPTVTIEEIDLAINEYKNWACNEISSDKESKSALDHSLLNVSVAYNFLRRNYGLALVELNSALKNAVLNESNAETYLKNWERRVIILNKLGWKFWSENMDTNKYFIFPKDFANF